MVQVITAPIKDENFVVSNKYEYRQEEDLHDGPHLTNMQLGGDTSCHTHEFCFI